TNPETEDMILPIGGPGPAITPMDQHAMLETLLGRPVAVRRMPIGAMRMIVSGLSAAGTIWPQAAQKASLARIGLYYATHSMLVVDPDTGRASARATPQTGSDHLIDHYKALLSGEITHDLAEHAVF
ncbi:MAG: epimerase, partial [Pseudomonadota bacterium]